MEVKVNASVKKEKKIEMNVIAEEEEEDNFEEKMVDGNDDKKVDFDFGGSFSFGNIVQNKEKNVEIIQDDEKKQIVFEFGSFSGTNDGKENGFADLNLNGDDRDSG